MGQGWTCAVRPGGLVRRVYRVKNCYSGSALAASDRAFVKPFWLKRLYCSGVRRFVRPLPPEELGRATCNGPSLLPGS
jgi:hypothetical protein